MQKQGKIKLYLRLLDLELAEDEQKAKSMIMAGQVIVDDQRVDKPGEFVSIDSVIRVKGQRQFVSRGGMKLQLALTDFGIEDFVRGSIALDVGASTGGFTDCLLQNGAHKVFALDVGTNQLSWKIRSDRRVVPLEKTDIRQVDGPIDPHINFVVADISFNSLTRLVPSILAAVPSQGVKFLLLVKPQFELSSALVPAGGVVLDDQSRSKAVDDVKASLKKIGPSTIRHKDCRLAGRMGNREVFIFFET